MAIGFTSRGALAGERLCPAKRFRPLAGGGYVWQAPAAISVALAGSCAAALKMATSASVSIALAGSTKAARAAVARSTVTLSLGGSTKLAKGMASSLPLVLTITAVLRYRSRAPLPVSRTLPLYAESRLASLGRDDRALPVGGDRRMEALSTEHRIIMVPPDHNPAVEVR